MGDPLKSPEDSRSCDEEINFLRKIFVLNFSLLLWLSLASSEEGGQVFSTSEFSSELRVKVREEAVALCCASGLNPVSKVVASKQSANKKTPKYFSRPSVCLFSNTWSRVFLTRAKLGQKVRGNVKDNLRRQKRSAVRLPVTARKNERRI